VFGVPVVLNVVEELEHAMVDLVAVLTVQDLQLAIPRLLKAGVLVLLLVVMQEHGIIIVLIIIGKKIIVLWMGFLHILMNVLPHRHVMGVVVLELKVLA
tara:strand:+ start:67 stop:363 length:297 start_codon:yes stop_codon:yes gene_type:complete